MPKVATTFLAALLGGVVVALAFLVAGVGGGGGSTKTVVEQAPVGSAGPRSGALTARAIYRRDAPGVVYIRARFDEQGESVDATGSGFVIGRGGSIVTNAHVVGDAKQVTVKFSNDKITTARVAGTDPSTDIALLLVDPKGLDLHKLELGESKDVRVGDAALAIGNPFGLERTLTTGVISAVQRQIPSLQAGFDIGNVLQTDAAINPGNSGGPLLDALGRVIGVNSQIETGGAGSSGGNVGIGFAIPVDILQEVIPRLRKNGSIQRAYLGVGTRTIDDSLASLKLPTRKGSLVLSVEPGSPAAAAGLRGGDRRASVGGDTIPAGGDIIVAIDGKAVTSNDDVSSQIGERNPGDSVKIAILRDGKRKTLTVKLAKRPDDRVAIG
ncbi:MAG TPA: trypsin-like peptidase domain-containing protein [Solirubrobacteraceae bacterium]